MYREITLKNNVIVLSVPFVHHTELQNFLIALIECCHVLVAMLVTVCPCSVSLNIGFR